VQLLSQTDAYGLAMRNHPRLRQRLQELAAARTEQQASRWLRYPTVTAQAGAAVARSGGSSSPAGTTWAVNQPLWDAGRTDAQIDTLGLKLGTAQAQFDEARVEVLLGLAQAYGEHDRLRRRSGQTRDNVQAHQRLLDLIQRRVDQRVSSQADLTLARTRWLQARAEATATESAQRRARNALEPWIGQPLDAMELAPVAPVPEVTAKAEVAVEAALAHSALVKRLQLQTALARNEARLSESALYPKVGLRYEYQSQASNSVPRHALRLALEYQSGAGLASWAAVEASRQRIVAAEEAAIQAQTELRQQVRNLALELEAQQAQLATAREVEAASQAIMASFLRQFTAGRKSWLEVLNAQREVAQAVAAAIDLEHTAQLAHERLGILTGRTDPALPAAPARTTAP
jgi:adhesin transport system outer membrane protein